MFLLFTATSILGLGIWKFRELTGTNPLSQAFIEEVPPELSWHEEPRGLGAEPITLTLTASDKDSGLDEVVVRVSQQNQPRELLRRNFGVEAPHNETIEVVVNPKELGLKEGNAELQIAAFDKSLWSNSHSISKIIEVNFLKPQIAVLTPQQNGVLGGSELVFYRVTGKTPDAQGVVGQGTLYTGYPALGWDSEFNNKPNVYIAFYPIPASFNDESDTMQLIARDNLGNSASSGFNYRIRSRRWSSFRVTLSEQSALTMRDAMLKYAQHEKLSVRMGGNLSVDFKALLKSLAVSDDSFLATALSESAPRRLWSGAFLPPVPSSPNNSAGDQRTILIGDQEVSRSRSSGVRFPLHRRTPVQAGNGGRVVFVGELGLLGNTVVLDHGFGLSTVYGHMSEIIAQRGASVTKGQILGSSGTSGFAQGEEVYFETRVHGIPVSPNEWWDETWVTDHIENKVDFVKRDVSQ